MSGGAAEVEYPAERAAALRGAGAMAYNQGRRGEAESLLEVDHHQVHVDEVEAPLRRDVAADVVGAGIGRIALDGDLEPVEAVPLHAPGGGQPGGQGRVDCQP